MENLNYLRGKTSTIDESMIYGDIEQQIQIVNIYSDILQERERIKSQRLRENFPHFEGPVHPLNPTEVLQHASSI